VIAAPIGSAAQFLDGLDGCTERGYLIPRLTRHQRRRVLVAQRIQVVTERNTSSEDECVLVAVRPVHFGGRGVDRHRLGAAVFDLVSFGGLDGCTERITLSQQGGNVVK
jgi:hypothetical protein